MLFEFKILKYTHVFTLFYTVVCMYYICVSVNNLDSHKEKIKFFPCGGIPKLKYMYSIFTIANAATMTMLEVIPYKEDVVMLNSSGLWIHGINVLSVPEVSLKTSVQLGEVVANTLINRSYEDIFLYISELKLF